MTLTQEIKALGCNVETHFPGVLAIAIPTEPAYHGGLRWLHRFPIVEVVAALPRPLTRDALAVLPPWCEGVDTVAHPSPHVGGDPNRYGSGRSRFITHGLDDSKELPCIEDLGCQTARTEWKDYHIERDAKGGIVREGPKPFKTRGDREAYYKRFGFEERGHGDSDHQRHPLAEQLKKNGDPHGWMKGFKR